MPYDPAKLDQVSFGLIGRNELVNQTSPANVDIVKAYKTLISAAVKLFKDNASDEDASKIAEDILSFQASLAQVSGF